MKPKPINNIKVTINKSNELDVIDDNDEIHPTNIDLVVNDKLGSTKNKNFGRSKKSHHQRQSSDEQL